MHSFGNELIFNKESIWNINSAHSTNFNYFLILSKHLFIRTSGTIFFRSLKHSFTKMLYLVVCYNNICYPKENLEKGNSIKSENSTYKFILKESGNFELKNEKIHLIFIFLFPLALLFFTIASNRMLTYMLQQLHTNTLIVNS